MLKLMLKLGQVSPQLSTRSAAAELLSLCLVLLGRMHMSTCTTAAGSAPTVGTALLIRYWPCLLLLVCSITPTSATAQHCELCQHQGLAAGLGESSNVGGLPVNNILCA
jgi:hypothetical protein